MIDIRSFSQSSDEDEALYASLRASSWEDFYGQTHVKEALRITILAAQQRKESLDHVLLYGPPGLGKTTLSHLIAKEMGANLRITSGTALTKVADLAAILTNLQTGDVLFVDEIHRLPKSVEEALYPAMEDFALDVVIGKGPSARTLRLEVPRFTLVGATTKFGALTGPFRDRFGMTHRMEYYPTKEMSTILQKAASKLNIELDNISAELIAQRSRGTPRIGLKLMKRVRDFAQVRANGAVSEELVKTALDMLQVDTLGLDDTDRRLLLTMIDKYKGGPVGLTTLAAALSEDPVTIEEVVEPYLLQLGLLQRTPKGRVVQHSVYSHLGRTVPQS